MKWAKLIFGRNGKGFDPKALADNTAGNGIFNMKKRLEDVSGSFGIASSSHGTTVQLTLPDELSKKFQDRFDKHFK